MSSKLCVFGGQGFLGKNIVADFRPSSSECDLLNPADLRKFFQDNRFTKVINCAAEHGSITQMTSSHTMYLQNNLLMSMNLLRECNERDIEEVLMVGSISGFPESVKDFITEDDFFGGEVSTTNYGYNTSKRLLRSLVKTYQMDYGRRYKVVHLGNVYGPHMKFGSDATIVGNLIYKIWQGKKYGIPVELFGSGRDVRSLTYVSDATYLMHEILSQNEFLDPIIVSSGYEISVASLANLIAAKMNFKGEIKFSGNSKGFSRKVAKSAVIETLVPGFRFTTISEGLDSTVSYFLSKMQEENH